MTSQLSIRDKSDKMYLRRLCHAGLLQVCRSALQHIIAILFLCFYFFGRPLRTENTVFHSTTGVTLHFLYLPYSFLYLPFPIDHNAPCLQYPPQHFTYPLFPISTGYYIRPQSLDSPQEKSKTMVLQMLFFSFGGGRGREGGGRGK